MAAQVLAPLERILVQMTGEPLPRLARERVVLEYVSPTVYVVSDCSESILVLDFGETTRLLIIKVPPRNIPAAPAGVGGDLPPGIPRNR